MAYATAMAQVDASTQQLHETTDRCAYLEEQLAAAACHTALLQQQVEAAQSKPVVDMGVQAEPIKTPHTRSTKPVSTVGLVLAAGALAAGATVVVMQGHDKSVRPRRQTEQQEANARQIKWTLRAMLPLGRT